MTIKYFAPLDQYQPFIDEFGRVTPEWYTWLDQLCEELNRLREMEARLRGPTVWTVQGGIDG